MRLIDADRLKTCFRHEKPSKPVGLCYERVIDEQPTIEPCPQWIPCSEDLPKKSCECIVTIEVQIWENTHRIVRKTKFVDGRFKGADKVVAWTPLPEAYGGEQK